jgi:lipoyl(octanoyl) transferase
MRQAIIRQLGRREYQEVYREMQAFNDTRQQDTLDEIWYLEHDPVYTLGLAGQEKHLLSTADIPVIKTDRGGQVTYHGPGQLVVYLMIDLRRKGTGVKEYVRLIEQSLIDYLETLDVFAKRLAGAPGVYVSGRKIAALGVRVRRGCAYHGLALNVDMELSPFNGINPCGYEGMKVTQLFDEGCAVDVQTVFNGLLPFLSANLGCVIHQPVTMQAQTVARNL